METILILANGVWGKVDELVSLAEEADYIITVDGGWAKLKRCRLNLQVDLLIGDLDSLDQSKFQVPDSVEIKKYPREKDKTDLELAVDEAIKLGPKKVVIFGALGRRVDHTLGSIFLLERLAHRKIKGEIIEEDQYIYSVPPKKELSLPVSIGDTISLIPLTDKAEGITTEGLKYQLKNGYLKRTATLGISNVATSPTIRVKIDGGVLLVVHQPSLD